MAPLLARSDMLGFMLKPMADDLADRYGLTYCAPPYPLAGSTIGMMSHRTLGAHPAVVWLRRLILDYACGEDATPDAPPA